jgi:mannose-6-phosphate isomerase
VRRGGQPTSLAAVIAQDPERELGAAVVGELGPQLPFLLKVLAAAEPLSLQVHPSTTQAKAGWADEERRGVPRDAGARSYKDTSHKPELLCALTPVDLLSGFRRAVDTLRLFDSLAVAELEEPLRPLRQSPDVRGLAGTFHALMTMPLPARVGAVAATARACLRQSPDEFARERAWTARFASLYPNDIGVVSALLLELVHLEPGAAIYLGPGNLHAYLEGAGVEIMASSDNVLRGGLTKKHVDVAELLRVVDVGAAPVLVEPRELAAGGGEAVVYETPAREFRLSRLNIKQDLSCEVDGPEILLATEGHLSAGAVALPKGSAMFVPASTGRYSLGGDGTVFRATTNLRVTASPTRSLSWGASHGVDPREQSGCDERESQEGREIGRSEGRICKSSFRSSDLPVLSLKLTR